MTMAIDLSALQNVAAAQTGIRESVKAFIAELKAQLAAELADDPAKQAQVNAIMEELLANNQDLSDAIAATPPTP